MFFPEDFPNHGSELVLRVLCELGLASLLCLAGFAGFLIAYRKKLNRLRKECFHLVIRLLEAHLGRPQVPMSAGGHRVFNDVEAFRGATEISG